jgi:DNA-binding winged helix-turn-helix (wHTH) protein
MTAAIALSTHRARMLLEAGPGGIGPFLDDHQPDRPTPSREVWTGLSSAAAIRFGSFCLFPRQRLLFEADQPVPLGSRALDILIALIERHGELVTRRELMLRVWPGITVVDANLTVHIAALRRALRDGQAGNRYLVTTPGQGYRFVAPISTNEDPQPALSWLPPMERDVDVRTMLARLIADEVRRLASELLRASDLSVGRPTHSYGSPV